MLTVLIDADGCPCWRPAEITISGSTEITKCRSIKRPNNPDSNLVTPSPLPTQPQVSCRFAKKLSPASFPGNFHHAA